MELTLIIIFIKRLCKKAVLISYNSHVRFVHRPCTIRTLALYHSYMAIIRNETGSMGEFGLCYVGMVIRIGLVVLKHSITLVEQCFTNAEH